MSHPMSHPKPMQQQALLCDWLITPRDDPLAEPPTILGRSPKSLRPCAFGGFPQVAHPEGPDEPVSHLQQHSAAPDCNLMILAAETDEPPNCSWRYQATNPEPEFSTACGKDVFHLSAAARSPSPNLTLQFTGALMRLVFGRGTLVTTPLGFGLEVPRLHVPALILPSLAGASVPDLTSHLGQIIGITGQLSAPGDNISGLSIHFNDITSSTQEAAPQPLCGVVSGNLGKAAEENPKGDRVSASLAYHTNRDTDATSWLRITALRASAISGVFEQQEKGTALICVGEYESYLYNKKPNLHLWLTTFEVQSTSSGYKAADSLATSFTAEDCAPSEQHAFEEA
jgi:hypothetical protein